MWKEISIILTLCTKKFSWLLGFFAIQYIVIKIVLKNNAPLTLASGPLKVDWLGWLKYWRLLLEYLRKVSAVLLAKVQAFKKASFCSWCLLMSWVIKVTRSMSLDVRCFCTKSSSLRYSRSRLSRTEQTWKKREQSS